MNLNARDKLLLSVLAIVLAVGGGFWFVVKPARASADAAREQLAGVQSETSTLQDQLTRLRTQTQGEQARIVEAFALSKAIPARPQVAGAIVQLQGLAEDANVRLSEVRTSSVTDYGSVTATEMVVGVQGKYFDVDDFMFRVHNMVTLDENRRPDITGRLFATKGVRMELEQSTEETGLAPNAVNCELTVLIFTSQDGTPTTPASATATGMMSPKAAEQKSINAINATNASAGGTP